MILSNVDLTCRQLDYDDADGVIVAAGPGESAVLVAAALPQAPFEMDVLSRHVFHQPQQVGAKVLERRFVKTRAKRLHALVQRRS